MENAPITIDLTAAAGRVTDFDATLKWQVLLSATLVSGLLFGVGGLAVSALTGLKIISDTTITAETCAGLILLSLALLIGAAHSLDRLNEIKRARKLAIWKAVEENRSLCEKRPEQVTPPSS